MDRVLIVDDKESFRDMLKETLAGEEFEVVAVGDGKSAKVETGASRFDIALVDLRLPGKDGIHVLRDLKKEDATLPVIMMTAYGSVETAVKAMKEGAYDFIAKPFDSDHLIILIKRAIEEGKLVKENIYLKSEVRKKYSYRNLVGTSEQMLKLYELIERISKSDSNILVEGETGTGKELVARSIHYASNRHSKKFIAVVCSALPEPLLESELFGHKRGSFTGAIRDERGLIEEADGGTIFLDEIGDAPLSVQAKLLRVLEEGEIRRVGDTQYRSVDVRVLCATNKRLADEVKAGRFREDLFYRLNVIAISVPPLRERRKDIPLLAEHFLKLYSTKMKKRVLGFEKEAMEFLVRSDWPGNVRQLENVIERSVALGDTDKILLKHLEGGMSEPELLSSLAGMPQENLKAAGAWGRRMAEKELISKALQEAGGNKSLVARRLEVSYKTLLAKVREYGLG
ncbi:sigma-54-dependent Fis family transcriptional regulator [candidate division TA06 bacterium]|uniref:Sigma-54-dependent Fis family transcriptional regulator n=1 Tax=candidate division TA06 bacterium TaxID=2250710 RepID=A0A523XV57_UNCT6|nr:MAG: sigma-54-dependent Fis family transcriptional regulator [candidate division TA06 bacterium]